MKQVHSALKDIFIPGFATEENTIETIHNVFKQTGIMKTHKCNFMKTPYFIYYYLFIKRFKFFIYFIYCKSTTQFVFKLWN